MTIKYVFVTNDQVLFYGKDSPAMVFIISGICKQCYASALSRSELHMAYSSCILLLR